MSTDVMLTDEKVTDIEAVDYPSDDLDDLVLQPDFVILRRGGPGCGAATA